MGRDNTAFRMLRKLWGKENKWLVNNIQKESIINAEYYYAFGEMDVSEILGKVTFDWFCTQERCSVSLKKARL